VPVDAPIRFGAAKPITISTKFYADHIQIDGVSFQYRPRERTPMGQPENDFCIRVAGVDVPLMAVLRLRNIGVGEFRLADKMAVATAELRQRQNRDRLNCEYEHPAQLNRIYNEMQRAMRDADKSNANFEHGLRTRGPMQGYGSKAFKVLPGAGCVTVRPFS
jgi:hypothetical protein